MRIHSSYLRKLKFDPSLMRGFIARYIANPRLVTLITIAIIGAGIYSFVTLPRTLNPQIKIPIVIVTTVLPGAGPADVESLVTVPLEDSLTGLSNVKTVQSSSRDSVSLINLEFNSGVDPDKARGDVQSAVDAVQLPTDAQDPKVIKLDFENQPIWTFVLTSSGDDATLMRFADQLKIKLKDLSDINEVQTTGLETQEVEIIIRPEALSTYNINPQQITQAVISNNKSFPAGVVRTQNLSFSLVIDQSVTTVDDIRNLDLNLGGNVVKLSQVADVSYRSKAEQPKSLYAKPNQDVRTSVTFDVFKTSTADINKAYQDSKKLVDDEIKNSGNRFEVSSVLNTSGEITKQFNELVRDFAITVSLVFISLFIFLGFRQAVVASLSIPLSFLISFVVMKITGTTLNFLSFFSLLLVLGLVVDDTIVVISAMTAYFRTGKFTPLQTGLLVWRDFSVPIFTTTITTVWAFLPMLLSTGIIGEFIKSIPIVVSTTLLASLFVAMLITLPAIIILLRPQIPKRVAVLLKIIVIALILAMVGLLIPKNNLFLLQALVVLIFLFVLLQVWSLLLGRIFRRRLGTFRRNYRTYLDEGLINLNALSLRYREALERILISSANRRRMLAVVLIFSLFSFALVPLGFVKNEFFPKTDEDFIYLSLELPAGTALNITEVEAANILNDLKNTPDTEFALSNSGRSFNAQEGGVGSSDLNVVLFTLKLLENRHRSSINIAQDLRNKYASYNKGDLSVTEVSGGPPAGADIQIKLFGPDLNTLNTYADQIVAQLKTEPGVDNPQKSIKPGTSKLVFEPDSEKISSSGLSIEQVGGSLRLFASGFQTKDIKLPELGTESKDVTIRTSFSQESVNNIGSIMIPSQTGSVALDSLGKIEMKPNPTLITREDGKRTISVIAGVLPGHTAPEINSKLTKYANSLALPEGYSWKTGGVNEQNQESVNSILVAMILSFLLIIVTMVIQFGSFRKALIVMLVIPLSISGVFITFALTHTPLSFPALIGMLALFGIVVKNSILVVDKINQNIKHRMGFLESILDGSSSRLEPIALTSMAAILGLTPITLSDPLWRGLGGAIIAGLLFSGTIMLFFIPLVYYFWFNQQEKARRTIRRR